MLLTKSDKFTTLSAAKRLVGVSYLGSINSSAKIMKNQKVNHHYTYIIYLAPADSSGVNVCSHSTAECRLGCLATSGRAAMDIASGANKIKNARIRKTLAYSINPEFFLNWIVAEMKSYKAKAERDGYEFSARLNGTSDIDYSRVKIDGKNIFEIFPDVIFYDYTKNHNRLYRPIPNYTLTLSFTGHNGVESKKALDNGFNVAMIFNITKKTAFPEFYDGYTVIDGDLSDLRVGEAKGVIIALRWKNIADKESNNVIKNSIFVVQPRDISLTNHK